MIRSHFSKPHSTALTQIQKDRVEEKLRDKEEQSVVIAPTADSEVALPIVQKGVTSDSAPKAKAIEKSVFTVLDVNNKDRLWSEDEKKFGIMTIAQFLFVQLGKWGDPLSDVVRAIEFALSKEPGRGGFIILTHDKESDELVGCGVVNNTNMKGYFAEHMLCYLAVSSKCRGQGIGKKIIAMVSDMCKGDVTLHVEPDNPARFLYQKMGFKHKYLEMRIFRGQQKQQQQQQ